jgi:uncharacterized glyoxalase superfamily protein PhnB
MMLAHMSSAGAKRTTTMFFASRFAQIRDRFGINWMILHGRPMR